MGKRTMAHASNSAERYNHTLTTRTNKNRREESPYEKEAHLVEFVQHLLPQLFAPEGTACFLDREVGVGRSIADLVLLIGPHDLACPALSAVSVAESVILAALRQWGPTRIDLLEIRCGFERHGLRQGALKRLTNSGTLLRERGGRVTLCPEYVQGTKIVAIEAKLTKWRDALDQAVHYRRYADETFVLLPAQNAEPAIKARADFEDAGVGLLVVKGGQIVTLFDAAPSTTHDWRRDYVYFRLLSSEKRPPGQWCQFPTRQPI
jgi:hypothetical protein